MKRPVLLLALALSFVAACGDGATLSIEPDASARKPEPTMIEACVAQCDAQLKASPEDCPDLDVPAYVAQCKKLCPDRLGNVPDVCAELATNAFNCAAKQEWTCDVATNKGMSPVMKSRDCDDEYKLYTDCLRDPK